MYPSRLVCQPETWSFSRRDCIYHGSVDGVRFDGVWLESTRQYYNLVTVFAFNDLMRRYDAQLRAAIAKTAEDLRGELHSELELRMAGLVGGGQQQPHDRLAAAAAEEACCSAARSPEVGWPAAAAAAANGGGSPEGGWEALAPGGPSSAVEERLSALSAALSTEVRELQASMRELVAQSSSQRLADHAGGEQPRVEELERKVLALEAAQANARPISLQPLPPPFTGGPFSEPMSRDAIDGDAETALRRGTPGVRSGSLPGLFMNRNCCGVEGRRGI